MDDVCHICGEAFADGLTAVACEHRDYSAQELELMGLEGYFEDFYRCERAAHEFCIRQAERTRDCCETPSLLPARCIAHSELGEGFLCLDCNRWHAPACAANRVVESYGGIPQGICNECDAAGRSEAAISELSRLGVETLEAMSRALRATDVRDERQLVRLLAAVSDLREVRVPHAAQPRVSLAIAVRAVKRATQAAKALQSGLEREFLELLSRAGLDAEFVAQRAIPAEVASRDGNGRKAIVATPDFAHRSLPYVVFLDGRIAHSSEAVLADDAEITAELQHLGFVVRRFRSAHLSSRFSEQTLATIRRDLDQVKSEPVRRAVL